MRVGIFQPGKVYDIYMRFSGQDKETQNDPKGDAKGLAIKFINVAGRKVTDPTSLIILSASSWI